MKTLGERIRELREKEDLSLRELARKAELSPAFISDIELGRRHPSPKVLKRLARDLHTSPEDLKRFDSRPPLKELRRVASENPRFAVAYRRVLDSDVTPDQLLDLAKGKPIRGKKR
ncbi:MAG: helix-turn-helix transcriptional regulator [Candidatus Liptonbacteria bacterium]|nr:helix-turn-helix transcriptional regulator [Candidatus Liptonbacteria bacterium]